MQLVCLYVLNITSAGCRNTCDNKYYNNKHHHCIGYNECMHICHKINNTSIIRKE